MGGWIKLHRKMREWQHYQRPTVRLVFEELLFCANTEEQWFHGIKIKRGETVVSIDALCAYTGFARATVVEALKILEDSKEIKRTKCWRGARTKIINFDKYQGSEPAESGSTSSSESSSNNELQNKSSSQAELHTELHTELLTELEQEYIKNNKKHNNNIDDVARAREEDFIEEVFSQRSAIEAFLMSERLTEAEARAMAKAVVSEWAITGKQHRDDVDKRQHLLNQIRIKKKQRNNGQQNNQPSAGSNSTNTVTGFKIIKADG